MERPRPKKYEIRRTIERPKVSLNVVNRWISVCFGYRICLATFWHHFPVLMSFQLHSIPHVRTVYKSCTTGVQMLYNCCTTSVQLLYKREVQHDLIVAAHLITRLFFSTPKMEARDPAVQKRLQNQESVKWLLKYGMIHP